MKTPLTNHILFSTDWTAAERQAFLRRIPDGRPCQRSPLRGAAGRVDQAGGGGSAAVQFASTGLGTLARHIACAQRARLRSDRQAMVRGASID